MDIYLIRHTKTGVKPGTCYGLSEIPLADTFNDDSKLLLNKLPLSESFEIISSPLKRCTQLAERITTRTFKRDIRLVETNFGDWELQEWSQIMLKYKDLYNDWEKNYINIPPPNGESFLDLYMRGASFIDDIVKSKDKNYFIITHGGVIRALLAYWLKLPLENAFSLSIDQGSVTKLSINKQLRLVHYINR